MPTTGASGVRKRRSRSGSRRRRTSIAEQTKDTTTDGKVSLFVRDEEQEGKRAHLVLVSPDGSILAQREVVVGKNR